MGTESTRNVNSKAGGGGGTLISGGGQFGCGRWDAADLSSEGGSLDLTVNGDECTEDFSAATIATYDVIFGE